MIAGRPGVDGHGTGWRVPSSWATGIAAALSRYRAGDRIEAARRCRDIIARDPGHSGALNLLGAILLDEANFADAADFLSRAATRAPRLALPHAGLGMALLRLNRDTEAEAALRRATELAPEEFPAWNNLGIAVSRQQRFEEAIDCFRRSLALRPDFAPAQYNLGRALAAVGRIEEAVDALYRASAQPPGGSTEVPLLDVYDDLYGALCLLGRDEEALAVCRAMQPLEAGRAEWGECLIRLKRGEFLRGWPLYEQRYCRGDHEPPHPRARPLDLAEVAGKRILVCGEQGHGDVIQFVRYVPLLARRGAEIYLSIYPELNPLLRQIDGIVRVLEPGEPEPPGIDAVTALPSLPLAFGTDLATIPANVPYLRVGDERLAAWRRRLGRRHRPRVGVCWRGSAASAPRSAMPLAALAPLLARPEFEFHALKDEIGPEDRQWLSAHTSVLTHCEALTDYAETAALIELLDLVVTIDTSVAHLAGALARSVWIMVPFAADWRWLLDRDDSPWYPTMRLFRQRVFGDWDSVVAAICQSVGVLAEQ